MVCAAQRERMSIGAKAQRYLAAMIVALTLLSGLGELAMNLGNVAVVHSIEPGWMPHDLYHYRAASVDKAVLRNGRALLDLAERLRASRSVIQWAKGRAALLDSDYQMAATILTLDAPDLYRNSVLYLDTLTALSLNGTDDSVIVLHDLIAPPEVHAVISDTVALAYIRSAHALLNNEQPEQARVDLQLALKIRSIDLYAQYHLWRLAENGGTEKVGFAHGISSFTTEAVSVRDAGLLEMVFDVFPKLMTDGLWQRTRCHNLIAYWVWQQPDSAELMSLVNLLIAEDPNDAVWRFYLGEIYDRQGLAQEALADYQQAADIDQANQLPQERLSRLSVVSASAPSPAAPDQRTVDAGLIASMAGVAVDKVIVGDDLLQSDPFSALPLSSTDIYPVQDLVEGDTFRTFGVGLAQGWYWSITNDTARRFVTGRDPFERPGSVRITNLWWPEDARREAIDPSSSLVSARFDVSPEWVMASTWFRVEAVGHGIGEFFVGGNASDARLTQTASQLPDTNGQWKRIIILGRMHDSQEMQAVLTNRGAANIWFQQVQVRSITLMAPTDKCADQPCVMFVQD